MTLSQFFHKYRALFVWISRLAVGATLVFSGFAKAVDPWGFAYKMEEYLITWGIEWLAQPVIIVLAAFIAMFEFTVGLMLALGAFRHTATYAAAVFMTLMLVLSAYIWIAEPVEDCGCFGDALVISNSATFFKNVILCLLILYLIPTNHKVASLVAPLYQWLPLAGCILYCLYISGVGYFVQPVVDFRPYKTSLSILPDTDGADDRQLAIYDNEFNDLTDSLISTNRPQVILAVSDPKYHNRARANLSNRICRYVEKQGGSMLAILPLTGCDMQDWCELANPNYLTYTAEETTIKALARGQAAYIFLVDGRILWKRNLYSLPSDFPESAANDNDTPTDNALTRILPVDDGHTLMKPTIALALCILLAFFLSIPSMRKQTRKQKSEKNA